ncbi:hypothetical protein V8B97DRAFT_1916856 [Scleroderma yunnanense]
MSVAEYGNMTRRHDAQICLLRLFGVLVKSFHSKPYRLSWVMIIGPKHATKVTGINRYPEKGGHLTQLEKVRQAIEGLSEPPRFKVTIPAGKPVNPMAPTLHHPKRRKVTSDSTEVPTLVPASAEHLTNISAVTAVNGAPGRHFGLQLQAPSLPTFVGSQSIHDKATSEPDGQNSPNQSKKLSISATQPIVDQLPPSPPPSHFNSLCNAEDKEIPYCIGNERVGVNYDILKHYYTTNCHPWSPSPTSLMSALMDLQSNAEGQPHCHGRYSKHSKNSIAPKPTFLTFYPLLWRKLLDLVKAQMWLHIAVKNAFPQLEEVVDGICCEVLIKVITHFEDKGWKVEADNDQVFVGYNVKKAVMKTLLFNYELYPLFSARNEEAQIKFVKDKADELLRTSV